ncbi:MAG: hypothetical protein ACJAV2_000741 [Myxococcota bacterium]
MAERQRFTIAREQAIAKMREYAMRHPDQYVLELIQAAVLQGAQWISVDATPTESRVAWVGAPPVTRDELARLFDYLFVSQTRADTRSLQQLALGVNAMLLRHPRSLVIESGNGTAATTSRATISRSGDITVDSAAPLVGTYIRATFREPGWRPWKTPVVPDEETLIRQRCAHLPIPILVDGRPILGTKPAAGLWAPGLERSVSFNERGVRGVLGIVRPGVLPRVRVVVGGVTIATLRIPELGESTAGIVCDDRLRKSADGVDIVQDEAWTGMLAIAQPHIIPLLRSEHASVSTADFRTPKAPTPGGVAVLVEPMRQCGLRPDVSVSDLTTLSATQPLFLVSPGSVIETHSALDPQRFPWPVLLLDERTGALLADRLPGRTIARLQSAEDARFVAEMQRNSRPVIHSARVTHGTATLWIRVHVDGDAPEPAADVGTPLLHIVDGVSRSLTRLPLDLPGVWAFVQAEELPPESFCKSLIIQALGRVFDEVPAADLTELRRAVVVEYSRPQLVATADGPRLDLWLPPALQRHAQHLHSLPLTDNICAKALADVQGVGAVLAISTLEAVDRLAPLERRLGVGHLQHPSRTQRRLFAVGTRDGHWIWLEPDDDWTRNTVTDLLIVSACIVPDIAIEGFIVQESPGPFVAHLVRDGQTPYAPFAGIALLCRRLIDLEKNDAWPEDDAELQRAIARVVCASQEQAEKLPLTVGTRTMAAHQALADDRLRVATAHGLSHHDRWTTALTLDEAIHLFAGRDLPLNIDDHRTAWNEDPGAQVVYRPVHRDWGYGWLALPRPYDPTLGVLGAWQGQTSTFRGTQEALPCRGWLELAVERADTMDADLDVEIRALYADLEDYIASHPNDEDASRYLELWHHQQPDKTALTRPDLQHHLRAFIRCTILPVTIAETIVSVPNMGAVVIRLGQQDSARLSEPGGDLLLLWSLAQRVCHTTNTDFVAASEALARSLITRTGG